MHIVVDLTLPLGKVVHDYLAKPESPDRKGRIFELCEALSGEFIDDDQTKCRKNDWYNPRGVDPGMSLVSATAFAEAAQMTLVSLFGVTEKSSSGHFNRPANKYSRYGVSSIRHSYLASFLKPFMLFIAFTSCLPFSTHSAIVEKESSA